MSTWLRDAKAKPEIDFISQWNSQRDIKFRPWRLLVDPRSEASNDKDFESAFTNNPAKIWPGEVGAVMLSNANLHLVFEDPD